MSETVWYDESKLVTAVYAFEDGVAAYTGWVIDLGDGTCRLANDPLLGKSSPVCGDRVDLYYNPCDPFSLPWIGYRVLPNEGEIVGRHFAPRREPTPEHKAAQKAKDHRKQQKLEKEEQNITAAMDLICLRYDYVALLALAQDGGLQIPERLLNALEAEHS